MVLFGLGAETSAEHSVSGQLQTDVLQHVSFPPILPGAKLRQDAFTAQQLSHPVNCGLGALVLLEDLVMERLFHVVLQFVSSVLQPIGVKQVPLAAT